MKYQDFKMVEEMFARAKKDDKKETSEIESFFKVYKAIKKFEEKQKKDKPDDKDKKKDDKKSGWEQMSMIQKITILTAIVPFIAAIQLTPFVILAVVMHRAFQ